MTTGKQIKSHVRVAVRLKGKPGNTQGIGAKVKLLGGAMPSQQREIQAGGHYLSGADTFLVFGTGSNQSMTLEVTWRNGTRSVVNGVKMRAYILTAFC